MTSHSPDPIRAGRRLALFARVPLGLGFALRLAQASGLFDSRDTALLGVSASALPAPWVLAVPIILLAALLPGMGILLQGIQKGLLFSIAGLILYLLVSYVTVRSLGIVLPLLAPIAGWYVSQVLGIGWRPHADQDVRHILPPDQRRVFISYRRSLDEVTARLLKHELTARGFDVFLDVDDLGPSSSFDKRLLEEIGVRQSFVLLLSPGSLDRCHDPADWIRLELEHALATRRRIVPVTRAGFHLGADSALPPSISSLPMHNAVEYASTHHDAVIDRLVSFLSRNRSQSEVH